jgi:LysR family hydrogen peroxide-inducible transcriptional activator
MSTRINFSLTQMEYVLAVRRLGHFAKAAEACHVTQPTLSMQIQKLEEDLGVILFDRSKKPILMTEAGMALIDQFQTILFESKKIESIITNLKGTGIKGQLIVGIIPTIAPYLLPSVLKEFDKKSTAAELKISEMQTQQIVEALNNDEIDVGILALPLKIDKVIEKPLYYEPFSILYKKGHEIGKNKKVKQSQLKSDEIWLLQEGHCLRNQTLDICSTKLGKRHKKFEFESGSLETLKNLVSEYGGYTLMPKMAARDINNKVDLIDFEKPIPARQIGLVYRREHHKSELIELLSSTILQAIPEDIRHIKQKDLDVVPI